MKERTCAASRSRRSTTLASNGAKVEEKASTPDRLLGEDADAAHFVEDTEKTGRLQIFSFFVYSRLIYFGTFEKVSMR
jgi:hypothetical protein